MNKFTHPKDAPEGHKWVTTGGQPATQVTCFDVDDKTTRRSIVALVGGELLLFKDNGVGTFTNLIDALVTRDLWINLYPTGHDVHNTREQADYFVASDRIARKRVTITEGDFDE